MMLQEAYELLGVGSGTDTQEVEAAYWRRVRALAKLRDSNPEAAEELERVNAAYQTVMSHRLHGPPRPRAASGPSRRRRFAFAGAALVLAIAGLVAGLGFREEIQGGAERGVEQTQQGLDDTITWLQSLDGEPTPTKVPPSETSGTK